MTTYSIQQLQLAMERGAEIEFKDRDHDIWYETDLIWFSPKTKYRLANPERDAHLTRFDLYPFNLERALAGEEVVTASGLTVLSLKRRKAIHYSLFATDERYLLFAHIDGDRCRTYTEDGVHHPGGVSCHDLFMKHAPKPVVKKSLTNETLEPWLQILALYKRKMPHAEWQAKWESGLELEYLDPANDSEWLDVDANPNVFYENVQFREKPTPKKFQSWRYDYIGVRNGLVYCELFSTQDECEKAVQSHDESVHGKIVKGCYLVEYEL